MDLFKELEIDFKEKSFGIIPNSDKRGGKIILKKLQKNLEIKTNSEFVSFTKHKDMFNIFLKCDQGIYKISSKYLVLATGGYGGIFRNTNNVKYKKYNVFEEVIENGGNITYLDSIFEHPFGYNNGKDILVGKIVKEGEFVNDKGVFVFDKQTRNLIKQDNYHEIFHKLNKIIKEYEKKEKPIYFKTIKNKLKLSPCVHYTSGGILTDSFAKVIGIDNLFAVGECQANGYKNGGRFPGYPFTAAIVYGRFLRDYFKHTSQPLNKQ